jgi:DNA-binding transcriptional regulator YiaG
MHKTQQKKPDHTADLATGTILENRRIRTRSGSLPVDAIIIDTSVWKSIQKPYAEAVKKLAELVSRSQKGSQTRGQRVRLRLGMDEQRGLPKLEVENIAGAEENDVDDLDAALAEARERGVSRAAEILARPEMLSAADFAKFVGVSRETIRAKEQRREVLGLKGAKRGLRYPKWQVTPDGALLPELPRISHLLGGDSWTVYRFLTQRHPELEGATAMSSLLDGKVDQVLAAAENTAGGFS